MTVLIVYATQEGQTARIARFVEVELCNAGHDTRVVDVWTKPSKSASMESIP